MYYDEGKRDRKGNEQCNVAETWEESSRCENWVLTLDSGDHDPSTLIKRHQYPSTHHYCVISAPC